MDLLKTGNGIIKEIKKSGPVTFARYMDMALYHPEEGYYMRGGEKIGAGGDFYTSPDVSPLFGRALADQLVEMWEAAGRPSRWTVLEQGAGKGSLARDMLDYIAGRHGDFNSALSYLIIEKSPSMKRLQEKNLSGAGCPGCGMEWLDGLEEIDRGQLTGCIFSNELLDAFPVHRVIMEDGDLKEIWVTCEGEKLNEFAGRLSTPDLAEYISYFDIELEEGQSIEINLAVRCWVKEVARVLGRGFVVTIDYGDTSAGLYTPDRPGGTIRSFRSHRIEDSLYEEPGASDITAHVNFTALMTWGREEGLEEAGYTTQSRFLMNMGIMGYLSPPDPALKFDPGYVKNVAAVKQLVMPGGMGEVFKVAAQYRGFDLRPALTGFGNKTLFRAGWPGKR
ncbi:MAG: SAM-dependent methyltransferase [Actinobacteria bacterium]|nr:SAM-dependent methyltransferase [Actinomycetota bacterium]